MANSFQALKKVKSSQIIFFIVFLKEKKDFSCLKYFKVISGNLPSSERFFSTNEFCLVLDCAILCYQWCFRCFTGINARPVKTSTFVESACKQTARHTDGQ